MKLQINKHKNILITGKTNIKKPNNLKILNAESAEDFMKIS